MQRKFIWLFLGAFCVATSACSAASTRFRPAISPTAATASVSLLRAPTLTVTPAKTPTLVAATCADLDTAWAAGDWPAVLVVLQRLKTAQQSCGNDSLDAQLYAAHFNDAAALEAKGQHNAAVEHYRAAFAVNSRGREALEALARLKALPTLAPPPCQPAEVQPFTASAGDFVTIAGHSFMLKSQPFYLRGVNYYPRHAPWEQFLTNSNRQEIAQELDLIASAGFNTIRIAVWYDPLFTCDPEKAIPNATGFTRLDALLYWRANAA